MNKVKCIPKLFVVIIAVLATFLTTMNTSIYPVVAGQTYNVTIYDFAFSPQSLTIRTGNMIVWTNNDPVIYTLWFVRVEDQTTYTRIGNEGLSDPILPGESWSWVFDESIELQYYSFERLWITGLITVRPPIPPVGGIVIPIDKFALLAPYIAIAVAVVAVTVGAVYARKRWFGKAVVQTP